MGDAVEAAAALIDDLLDSDGAKAKVATSCLWPEETCTRADGSRTSFTARAK